MSFGFVKAAAKKVAKAAAPPPPPPSNSGATSGNFVIPGYKPKTPIGAPYRPSEPGHAARDFAEAFAPREAHEAAQKERHEAKVQRAEQRQARIVDKYVTKAYSPKAFSLESVGNKVQKAKSDVSATREKLLTHPVVQKANEEGKVVGPKGLDKIDQPRNPLSLEGPLSHPHPATPGEGNRQAKKYPAVTRLEQLKLKKQEEGAPSTLEDLGYASIGIPGIGVGGDIAKLGEAAAETVPKLFAEGGAKQAAKDLVGSAGARAAAKAATLRGAPSDALDALRAAPKALKELPDALRGGARELPSAAKGAVRAAPGAAGRGVLGTGENAVHSVGPLAALGVAHKAGINVPGGALLEGTSNALEHHFGETIDTTARALPGIVTGPADLGIAAGQSIVERNPAALVDTAKSLGTGTAAMIGKLASDNPEAVENTIRKEVGLAPFVPIPAVLSKLHSSDLYTAPRGALRDAVEGHRAKDRDAQVAERTAAGKTKRVKGAKEIKQPVPVSGREENYIFRGLGTKIEGHKSRANVALDSTRADTYGDVHSQLEVNKLREAALGKSGRTSKLAKTMDREYEAAVSPMAKMGIPHSEQGHALMKELADYYGEGDGNPVPGSITDRMAAHEAAEHPELFSDKKHAALTKAFHEQAERLENLTTHHSERARRIAQNDFTNALERKAGKAPVFKPEERISEEAQAHTSPEEAAAVLHKRAETLRKRAEKAKTAEKTASLKAQADDLDQHAKDIVEKGEVSRVGAWAHYQSLKDQVTRLRRKGDEDAAHKVEVRKQALYAELKDYTHPSHKLDTSKLDRWSPEMVDAFAKEQDAVAASHGLGKPAAYVADKKPRGPDTSTAGLVERPFSSLATHVKGGSLAKSGEANARFEDLLQNSVVNPRTRIAYNQLVHDTLDENKVRVKVGDTHKSVLTEKEMEDAQNAHEWPANTKAIPIGVVKQALTGEHALAHQDIVNFLTKIKNGGPTGAVEAIKELPDDLKDEVLNRVDEKGTKYVAVNDSALDELIQQFQNPKHSNWRKAANVPTRLILNDPAWVFAQVFAKGIPIGAALGPDALIHGGRAIKAMEEIQKMDPDSQARIMSMIGSSAGVMGTPHGVFTHNDPYSDIRAIKHSTAGKKVWDLANGNVMGKWDRWNAAKMREFAATVRASKGFRNWYGGFKGLDKGIRDIAEKTKSMSPSERLDYISQHPEMARNLQRNLNRLGGNWNSFTAAERKVAPFVIFYPWMRYSLNWTFHTFPVDHPVAATALTFLAQRNANELQQLAAEEAKAAGVKGNPLEHLSDPLGYANPITQGPKGSNVFPVGTRIAPTLGVAGNTLATGNLGQILGSANPLISAGIEIGSGKNLYTGSDLKGNVLGNAANIGLGLSPFARAAESAIGFHGFNKGPRSATAEAYEKLNPGKTLRSVGTAYSPQTGKNFGLENALNRIEDTISKTGSTAQASAKYDETKTVASRQKTVTKMKAENKKAWAEKEKLFKAIDPSGKLSTKSAEEYERGKVSGEEPGSGGIYGTKKAAASIYKPQSTESSIYGAKNSKALQYRPPKEELHLPSIPKLPGLGGVTGAIGSLVGGAKAEAAVPKGKQPPSPPKAAHKVSLSGPLTSAQKEFGKELSRRTGLSPKTVGGWMLAEDSGEAAVNKQGEGDNNWLNIGPGASLSKNPRVAAQETAQLVNTGPDYGGIRESVGQGVGQQVAAIKASPWDGNEHYANGIPTDLVKGSGSAKVPKRTLTKYQAGIKAAAELNKAELPYVWGGGHNAGAVNPGSGVDCSGAVSYVLQHMGVKLPGGVVSGEMGHYLRPGPGAVTVFYNGEHTFMRIGDKYFGTSESNPGGGAGFFPTSVGKGEVESGNSAGTYAVGHVSGLGKKVASALGIAPLKGITGSAPSFPGVTLSSNGTTATLVPGQSTTQKKPGFSNKPIRSTPLKRLQEVERIFAGKTPTAGLIPGFESTQTSTTPDLAAIGKAVEESRKKLLGVS